MHTHSEIEIHVFRSETHLKLVPSCSCGLQEYDGGLRSFVGIVLGWFVGGPCEFEGERENGE